MLFIELLKVDDDAVDLSILRKVLLYAVLIVVYELIKPGACFCLESRYVCVCAYPPRAIVKAIYEMKPE